MPKVVAASLLASLLLAAPGAASAKGTGPLTGARPAQARETIPQAGPLSWVRFFEPCPGDCKALFDGLAPEDAAALRALPERVARTIEEVAAGDVAAWPGEAQGALALVESLGPNTALAVDPGKRPCTLIWFGFLDNGGEVVGRHQCRIDERDGELSLTKLTGEGRFVRLVELAEGGNAAVGRSYLPEQSERRYDAAQPNNRGNENFGNFVGLAFPAERNGLVIVSADMHGFTQPDATFFEVLVVE